MVKYGMICLTSRVISSSEIVEILLQHGSHPDAIDSAGRTALHLATVDIKPTFTLKRKKIIDMLLRHGANPNIQDGSGRTALMYAARCSYLLSKPIAECAGIDINMTDHTGATATHYAIAGIAEPQLRSGIFTLLLRASGQNSGSVVDSKNRNFLHYAMYFGSSNGCHFLNDGDFREWAMLVEYTAMIIETLLECDVDPHALDVDGKSPMDYVSSEMLNALLDACLCPGDNFGECTLTSAFVQNEINSDHRRQLNAHGMYVPNLNDNDDWTSFWK
ncbi:ankyrin repeat-containing domain protein [Trichophaea hybrida]|nr:ankyrin repeat-containing domain protein [Trichophaea hybrida]